ncbi:uncharacterized protein N7483_005164 [Penicillium malachiteum]|uniref:uncharacterized protein n=1 Tax=Penicillium malachiteum TaxID=1324776 RepID=UPI002549A8A2|nr:uncharacterized protein N7483_005164 [Penicillium malachiteum]KAJ5730656.1 hypothetical protein N7483_005164 [Penicillium malachiteum]
MMPLTIFNDEMMDPSSTSAPSPSPPSLTTPTSHLNQSTDSTVPRAPLTVPKPLLVVPLANFTDPKQEVLISRIQTFTPWRKAKVWTPRPGSLHIPLQPRSKYFPPPIPDSKGHIYELAILLHRLGHSKFLVADGLTLRQLAGDCRYGEEEDLSVVLVNIKPPPERKSIKSYFKSLSPLVLAERRVIYRSSEEWRITDRADEYGDDDADDSDDDADDDGDENHDDQLLIDDSPIM